MPRQVTAFSNPTVKLLRSLRDKKARREEGLFLAEGLRIITEARDSGRLPEILMFSAEGARHPLAAEIIAATEAAGGEAIETTPDILSKASARRTPASRRSTEAPRRSGSSPRRCAIRGTSGRS
jgi:TrmH family RNA methyltransferase